MSGTSGKGLEARRRSGRAARDTNPLLDAFRICLQRVERWWLNGEKPKVDTLHGCCQALDQAMKAPRLTDAQLCALVDILVESEHPDAESIAEAFESYPPLVWVGGWPRQDDPE